MLGAVGRGEGQGAEVRVQRRDIIVTEQAEDGSRFVIDAFTLVNRSDVPFPTWSAAIPGEVIGLDVAESDVSPAAIRHEGDRIALNAPVPSGQTRIVLHYVLPPGVSQWELLLDHAVDTLAVVTRARDMTVRGAAFATEDLGGAVHGARRHVAVAVGPGVEIGFAPVSVRRPVHVYWWIIVLAAALTMTLTLLWWWRRNAPLARAGPSI